MSHLRCMLALIAGMTLPALSAPAAIITSLEAVGQVPSIAGNGLNGAFYKRSVPNTTQARNIIATTAPDVTFISTEIDYANGVTDSTGSTGLLSNYLGRDFSRVTSGNPASFNLSQSVYRFSGFIAITSAMDTNPATTAIDIPFALGSDDGGFVKIGNSIIIEQSTPRSFAFSYGSASFDVPGLYPFETTYFENAGSTGVELFSSIRGGTIPTDIPRSDLRGIVPTSVLYTSAGSSSLYVPEPSAAALALPALLLATGRSRRNS